MLQEEAKDEHSICFWRYQNTHVHTLYPWQNQEVCIKHFYLFELPAKLVIFYIDHLFYLKEQLESKLWLFRCGYLAEIFLKMNEVSLLFQGKHHAGPGEMAVQ